MWIQWSLTRLVRWRVRDWASCFTGCSFPLDDETDGYRSSAAPPQRQTIRNMVFDMKDESKGRRIAKKLLRRNRSNKNNKCTRMNLSSTVQVQAAADEYTSNNDSSWPHFADEDYIVFCFREDGAFDVVKDCKSEVPPNSTINRSSWPVNQKVNYGEEVKRVDTSSHVERSNEVGCDNIFPASTDEGDITPVTEAEEEEMIYLDAESSSSRIRGRYRSDHQEIENQAMVSMASSTDSNHSDNSTGSFAFPVLSWEWMGSPAQMPKSEGLHLRKHKSISLSFQCCRF